MPWRSAKPNNSTIAHSTSSRLGSAGFRILFIASLTNLSMILETIIRIRRFCRNDLSLSVQNCTRLVRRALQLTPGFRRLAVIKGCYKQSSVFWRIGRSVSKSRVEPCSFDPQEHRSGEVGHARSAADLCSALPCLGRRVGADPISLGAPFGADDRALPWLQAADSISR